MEDLKVIINSVSGHMKAGEFWKRASSVLKSKGFSCSVSFTEERYHAISLAREAVLSGFRRIVALGGDGTMHEVLNGVMSQDAVPSSDVTLAMIPVGSGNDWPRYHRIPSEPEAAAEVLVKGKTMLHDVVRLESIMDGSPFVRYMINIGGLGYDSFVCRLYDMAKARGHRGSMQYLKCLLKGFMEYRCKDFNIKVDGRDFYSGPALSVALGNGRYCGGGMMQTPLAQCDDGLLDLTVVPEMWKPSLIFKLPRLYCGKIHNIKGVSFCRSAASIEISASPAAYLEIDGEFCGCTPVKAEIMPSSVKVITNL